MAHIISVHEYDLKPGVANWQFEQAVRDAESRGLFRLPGLVKYYFVKGMKGSRQGSYAAIWMYDGREAWEQLWGTPAHPRRPPEYPESWRIWEEEILAPLLAQHPDAIRFTTYETW